MTTAEKRAALRPNTTVFPTEDQRWYADVDCRATERAIAQQPTFSTDFPESIHGQFDTEDEALDWLLEQAEPRRNQTPAEE